MKYPLLATDLDGTLLTSQKQIGAETIEAIQEYRRQGGKVVICSGRSPLSTIWISRTLGLAGEPIVAYNGAVILDENRKVVEHRAIPQNTLRSFWKLCYEEGIYAHFYEMDTLLIPEQNKWNQHWIENNIPIFEKSEEKIELCRSYRNQCEIKVVDDFDHYFQKYNPKISKIAVFSEKPLHDFAEKIMEQVGNMEVSSSFNYFNLEISTKDTSKAAALVKVTEKLGLSMQQVAAIGDNYNDFQMLAHAGMGIAMGNAPEEVRHIADQVTTTNNEAGAAAAIRRLLLP